MCFSISTKPLWHVDTSGIGRDEIMTERGHTIEETFNLAFGQFTLLFLAPLSG